MRLGERMFARAAYGARRIVVQRRAQSQRMGIRRGVRQLAEAFGLGALRCLSRALRTYSLKLLSNRRFVLRVAGDVLMRGSRRDVRLVKCARASTQSVDQLDGARQIVGAGERGRFVEGEERAVAVRNLRGKLFTGRSVLRVARVKVRKRRVAAIDVGEGRGERAITGALGLRDFGTLRQPIVDVSPAFAERPRRLEARKIGERRLLLAFNIGAPFHCFGAFGALLRSARRGALGDAPRLRFLLRQIGDARVERRRFGPDRRKTGDLRFRGGDRLCSRARARLLSGESFLSGARFRFGVGGLFERRLLRFLGAPHLVPRRAQRLDLRQRRKRFAPRRHLVERPQGALARRHRLRKLCVRLSQGVEPAQRISHRAAPFGDLRAFGFGRCDVCVDRGALIFRHHADLGATAFDKRRRLLRLAGALKGALRQNAIDFGAGDFFEKFGALLRVGAQKGVEFALRQKRRATKLIEGEIGQFDDAGVDGLYAALDRRDDFAGLVDSPQRPDRAFATRPTLCRARAAGRSAPDSAARPCR